MKFGTQRISHSCGLDHEADVGMCARIGERVQHPERQRQFADPATRTYPDGPIGVGRNLDDVRVTGQRIVRQILQLKLGILDFQRFLHLKSLVMSLCQVYTKGFPFQIQHLKKIVFRLQECFQTLIMICNRT